MKKKGKKVRKIIDELMRIAPSRIEKGDLCHKINLQPYELSHLIRSKPEEFEYVNIEEDENNNNIFLKLNIEVFIKKY